MAWPTNQQQRTIEQMRQDHGMEDDLRMERTSETHGLIRQIWWRQQREMVIRPDGERIFWQSIR